MEENEKKIGLQDIHEAYQLLLKIVKAKNIFLAKLSSVQNKEESRKEEVSKEDVEVKVLKAASLFRRKQYQPFTLFHHII